MSEVDWTQIKFSDLEPSRSPESPPDTTDADDYRLVRWYKAVRDTPMDALTSNDVATALRQKIGLPYVVEKAMKLLRAEPTAGDMYEGEIFAALSYLGVQYYREQVEQAKGLYALCEQSYPLVGPGVQEEIGRLRRVLDQAAESRNSSGE